jgi:hypothetical protein
MVKLLAPTRTHACNSLVDNFSKFSLSELAVFVFTLFSYHWLLTQKPWKTDTVYYVLCFQSINPLHKIWIFYILYIFCVMAIRIGNINSYRIIVGIGGGVWKSLHSFYSSISSC